MAMNVGYLTSDRTSAGDEVFTPFYAVEPLLEFLPKDKIIWCPFDEKWSAFYQYFKENGYSVIRSSLHDGKDFFEYEPEKWDILVSNPPFSKKDKILKRAFSFGKPFAMLLPVNSIQFYWHDGCDFRNGIVCGSGYTLRIVQKKRRVP